MENNARKKSVEVLSEIYRNAHLALQSISNILPAVDNDEIKNELLRQHEEYERFSAKAAQLARDLDAELKEPNPMKKMMMWGSIKMSTLTDNSPSHIADMMLQGTVMGISALRTSAGDISCENSDAVCELLHEMIKAEEEFVKKWKEFL